jgi:hypothetical protein
MLKHDPTEAELIPEAGEALTALLREIPAVSVGPVLREPIINDARPDLVIDITAFGKRQTLIIEFKKNAQPRFARNAILQLRDYAAKIESSATLILAAPYLSPEVRALCKEQNIGYFDLQGNARIALENMFIEHTVPTRPAVDKRYLKSLFKPKSAQILRVLLRAPWKSWKVKELEELANVSLGHVSNIRTSLLEREWAIETPEGIVLTEPNMLLDAWRDEYTAPTGQRIPFYTIKHSKELEDASFLAGALDEAPHIARAAFSAAAWLAPYARVQTHYFYVDLTGYQLIKDQLELSQVEKGGNVMVTLLGDFGPLRDTVEAAPGIICTSPVQTYLDLCQLGERGREAADHLREAKLKWPT